MEAWLFYLRDAAIPVAFAVALLTLVELVSPLQRHSLKGRLRGLVFVAVGLAVSTLILIAIYRLRLQTGLPYLLDLRGLPPVLTIAMMIVVADFLIYWEHRFEHRFFWPVHSVHHSPTELNAATAYAHPLQVIPVFFLQTVPMMFIDFGGVRTPLAFGLLLAAHTHWIHSPTRVHLGPLRAIFVDNRFHRIHHSVQAEHFDKNFGVIFSLWDRLFGTAYFPEAGEFPEAGIDRSPPKSVGEFLLYPFSGLRRASAPGQQASQA